MAAGVGLATGLGLVLAGIPGPARAGTPAASLTMPLNINGKHVFWPSNVNQPAQGDVVGPSTSNDLIYHGGAVETVPKVYLTFWGSEWTDKTTPIASSFPTNPSPTKPDGKPYTLGDLTDYLTAFFQGVGADGRVPKSNPDGSFNTPHGTDPSTGNDWSSGPGTTGWAWNNIQTQYCQAGAGLVGNLTSGASYIGDVNCPSGATSITNQAPVYGGVWFDPTPAPPVIDSLGLAENLSPGGTAATLDPVAQEALLAQKHFDPNGTNLANETFFVFAPPGRVVTGYFPAPAYCGYHSEIQPSDPSNAATGVKYAFIPYLLDIDLSPENPYAGSCGMNYVNKANTDFGNGVFDGFSIVSGHEFAEAVTDPDNWPPNVQDGWNDAQTSENGDKCAWKAPNTDPGAATDMYVGDGKYFAVQGLWSNAANSGQGGCAVRYGTK